RCVRPDALGVVARASEAPRPARRARERAALRPSCVAAPDPCGGRRGGCNSGRTSGAHGSILLGAQHGAAAACPATPARGPPALSTLAPPTAPGVRGPRQSTHAPRGPRAREAVGGDGVQEDAVAGVIV